MKVQQVIMISSGQLLALRKYLNTELFHFNLKFNAKGNLVKTVMNITKTTIITMKTIHSVTRIIITSIMIMITMRVMIVIIIITSTIINNGK